MHHLAHHVYRGVVRPRDFRQRVEPDCSRERVEQSIHPDGTGFFVPVLDAAASHDQFIRTHRSIADENEFVVVGIGVDDIEGRRPLGVATGIVFPKRFINGVVKVEMDEVLELAADGGKQLGAGSYVVVHGPANVEKKQNFDGVVTLGQKLKVQKAGVVGGGANGSGQIEFSGSTEPGELAQATEGDLDVANAELDVVVEVAKFSSVPHFDGFAVPRAILADANALGVVTPRTKRGGTGGADEATAALVPFVLFAQKFGEALHQFVKAAQGLDLSHFLGGQEFFSEFAKPRLGNGGPVLWIGGQLVARKDLGKDAIEPIEETLVFDQTRTGQKVKMLDVHRRDASLDSLEQRQILGQRGIHADLPEPEKKTKQHGRIMQQARADARPVVAHGIFAIMAALFTERLNRKTVLGLTLVAVLGAMGCGRDRSPKRNVAQGAGVADMSDVGVSEAGASVGNNANAQREKRPKSAPDKPALVAEPLLRCFADDTALSPPRSVAALLERAAEKLDRANEEKPQCVAKDGPSEAKRLLKEALACCDETLRQDEERFAAHQLRALALVGLGRTDEAERAFLFALALHPNDAELLADAADFYIHQASGSAATDHTRMGLLHARRGKSLLLASDKRLVFVTSGIGAKTARDVPRKTVGAETGTSEGKAVAPAKAVDAVLAAKRRLLGRLLLLEGQALSDLGRASEALGPLEQAVAMLDSRQARYERGLVLFDLCRLKEARQVFADLIKQEPEDAWAHHQLGLALEMQGEQAHADQEFARARGLSPEDFPTGPSVTREQFRTLVASEVARLPKALQDDLRLVRLELAELPAIEDLTADETPLSPTIVGLFRGLPIGSPVNPATGVPNPHPNPSPNPYAEPRSIVLYRKNLLRAVTGSENDTDAALSELKAQIRTTLLHELGHFRGEDDNELRDRGLE